MRYVHITQGYDIDTLHRAEALFERFVGRRLAVDLYEDHVKVENNRAKLSRTPVVEILSVKATCERSSIVPWDVNSDIAIDDVREWGDGNVLLPSSLFGESFTSARITYLAGFQSIDGEVQTCVLEIASLIRQGSMDDFSGPSTLSERAQATINRFRERR